MTATKTKAYRAIEYVSGSKQDHCRHQLVFPSGVPTSPAESVVLKWSSTGDVQLELTANGEVVNDDHVSPGEVLEERLAGLTDGARPSDAGMLVFEGNLKDPLARRRFAEAVEILSENHLISPAVAQQVKHPKVQDIHGHVNGNALLSLNRMLPGGAMALTNS